MRGLPRALTRGDGVLGDDVTDNAKTIKSIPLVLRGPSKLEKAAQLGIAIIGETDILKMLNE